MLIKCLEILSIESNHLYSNYTLPAWACQPLQPCNTHQTAFVVKPTYGDGCLIFWLYERK